ncbi:lysine-sensitive aspartokinase 3 [Zobellella denitrificans]|uniref:Aspartokinase n=1 Tax=Zobellella denitrificans TaxID=347534 RepID=A0A231MXM2_9GAMM|nr:lysine-sensitive aspartokinase 3 [Zobellella denitrificans]ATG74357.1 aspartate kinase [Zobellella denitrificans]OXS14735.1 lysine-sensitive aspartokinase 3 [Zobellella denitrificans]
MSQLTVAKFGGTSVADADAMSRCAAILEQNPNTRLAVLSASSGVTNLLVALASGEHQPDSRARLLQQLTGIQQGILDSLGQPEMLTRHIEEILHHIKELADSAAISPTKALHDEIVAQGELMSTRLFVELLRQRGTQAIWFDVRKVMRTDDRFSRAAPDLTALATAAEEELKPLCDHQLVVTQGFIGAAHDGRTTTLGRGGSDYSAALLAEALNAAAVEIWTDVPGIYTTDPRLVSEARAIPEISFSEASEMATFGAKVLHPATLQPAVRRQIPVFVGSSKAPEAGGTWIRNSTPSQPLFRALALRRNQVLLTLTSQSMFQAHGFLAEVFGILARHKISVDLITTSEISVSLTLDAGAELLTEEVQAELSKHCHLKVEHGLALVALIGNRMSEVNGTGSRVFQALSDVNIRMICYGASPHNLCFLVEEDVAGQVVADLHRELLPA